MGSAGRSSAGLTVAQTHEPFSENDVPDESMMRKGILIMLMA